MLKNFRTCEAQTVFEIFVGFVGLHYGHYGLNECKLLSSRQPFVDFLLPAFAISGE